MTNSRLWNRREYDVTPAGYFTVLKPRGWFSAVRLPGSVRDLINGPITPKWPEGFVKAPADEQNRGGNGEQPVSLQILQPAAPDRSPVRLAFIALGAAVITFCLLLWICQP